MRKRYLEEAEGGERGEDVGFVGVLAEEVDGLDAGGVKGVMDVVSAVVADGRGWEGDAWGPLVDEVFDVGETVVAGVGEVFGELGSEVLMWLWASKLMARIGPDGGIPRREAVGAGFAIRGRGQTTGRGLRRVSIWVRDSRASRAGSPTMDGGVGLVEHCDGVG